MGKQIWDTVLTWDNTILVREQLSFLMMLYTFALSEPVFCIARGKETAEDIVLLIEGDQEELGGRRRVCRFRRCRYEYNIHFFLTVRNFFPVYVA